MSNFESHFFGHFSNENFLDIPPVWARNGYIIQHNIFLHFNSIQLMNLILHSYKNVINDTKSVSLYTSNSSTTTQKQQN